MMLKHPRLDHQFVRHLPDVLSPGFLYISMEYATASHLCCCGCGEEVVTPFAPAQWKMTFDGEAISLHPSIGNWLLKCRSHYVIKKGRVLEAGPWSDAQVAEGLSNDRTARAGMYRDDVKPTMSTTPATELAPAGATHWKRFWRWLSKQ